jgi:Leucine-rich repeat (LRR) protein
VYVRAPSKVGSPDVLPWHGCRYLDLNSNAISGTIPKELSTLTLLEELHLHNNKLTGNIPSQFTKLAAMGYFYVNKNALSKAIPTTLGAWGAAVAAAG